MTCNILFVFVFVSLIILQGLRPSNISAISPSFSRQELVDPIGDWSLIKPSSEYSALKVLEGRELRVKSAQNTSECSTGNHSYPFPDIAGVSYFSTEGRLNASLWLSSPFKEPPLNASNWLSPPFNNIPWYKAYYVMALGIPSTYDTRGTDYQVRIKWDVFGKNWTRTIEEVAPTNETRILDLSNNHTGFFRKGKSHVDFSLNLNNVTSPNEYRLLFYAAILFVKDSRFCVMTDISNKVYIPPPNFILYTEPKSVFLRPGDQKIVEVKVKSDSDVNALVSLRATSQTNDTELTLTPGNLSIAPYSISSSLLKVKASDDSQPHPDTSLVFANISIPTESSLRGRNIAYEKLNNSQSESIIENSNLTIGILPALTASEHFNSFLTSWFNPITGVWATISSIVSGILAWKIWHRRKQSNNNATNVESSKKITRYTSQGKPV